VKRMNKKFITPFVVSLIALAAGEYAPRFASACPVPALARESETAGLIPAPSAAVKQVRVTAERASIYAEPSRTSARIDIVEKGTVLNLFQLNKVKNVWYYVSYDSPRYGSRVSGFIQDSYVEPVGAEGTQPAKPVERKEPRKTEPPPPPEKPAPPPPKAEERAAMPEAKPVPQVERSLGLTPVPRGQTFRFPRREPQRQEMAWIPPAPVEKTEETKAALPLKEEKEKPPEKGLTEAPKESKPPQPRPAPPVKQTQPRIKEEKPKLEPEAKQEKAKARPQPENIEEKKPQFQPPPVQPSRMAAPRRGPGAFRLSLGYGNSYGGAGALLQVNIGMGVSLHGGVGMYPTTVIYSGTDWVKNEVLYSAGLKYYLPLGSGAFLPYLDLQYGGLRVEAAQIVSGIWESSYIYSHEQKTLQGISFLAGTEIRTVRFGLNGSLGASYSLTDWEFLQQKIFVAFDVGLVVYF
jgi:hypothetical protein